MKTIRVTVKFTGRIQGALGVSYPMERRKTIEVPDQFTYEEAKEAARIALYEKEGDDCAYEHVQILSVAFN
jgi:hypothetical protein